MGIITELKIMISEWIGKLNYIIFQKRYKIYENTAALNMKCKNLEKIILLKMLCISVEKTYVYYQNIAKYDVNNIYCILFPKYGLRVIYILWEWSNINIIYKIRSIYVWIIMRRIYQMDFICEMQYIYNKIRTG